MKNNNWFTIQRVHPRVYAIAEFSHWEMVVSYLFLGDTEALLIDTGMGYGDIASVVSKITGLPVSVLLTHAHWDHIGGVYDFQRVFLYDDQFESSSLSSGFTSSEIPELSDVTMYSTPFVPRSYRASGMGDPSLIKDGAVLGESSFPIITIHTPGHTPGSVCFAIPKLKLLFAGDTLYPGPIYLYLPESHFADYCESLRKLTVIVDDTWTVFPGHNATSVSGKIVSEAYHFCKQVQLGLLIPDKSEKGREYYQLNPSFSIIKEA